MISIPSPRGNTFAIEVMDIVAFNQPIVKKSFGVVAAQVKSFAVSSGTMYVVLAKGVSLLKFGDFRLAFATLPRQALLPTLERRSPSWRGALEADVTILSDSFIPL